MTVTRRLETCVLPAPVPYSYSGGVSDDTNTMQPIGARRSLPAAAGIILLYADPVDAAPSVFAFASPEVVLGREAPAGGVTLDLGSVSRVHARFEKAGEGWRIVDLGSRNGTFVEGHRVTRPEALRTGSEIRVGDVLLKFVAVGIDSFAPYGIDGTLAVSASRLSTAVPELVGGYHVDRIAAEVAAAAPTGLPVLALGETGTGKELVARAIHRLSGRSGMFCAVNCAAVPASLFESELFGVRKGAFTGADRDRVGLVKAADGGTLFLDEIGDMPLEMQAKLLRVLEAKEVRTVGSTLSEPVDVRTVCATHRDLGALVSEGRFRGDLLARIRGFDIVLPPLRARKEDLYQLVRHFLSRSGRPDLHVTFGFMLALCDHDWPFNVRECESTIRRAVALVDGSTLEVNHLPEALRERALSYGARADGSVASVARRGPPTAEELRSSLARNDGNVAAVARELSKGPKQIHRWMQRHGISPRAYRQ